METNANRVQNCSDLLEASIHFFSFLYADVFDRVDTSYLDQLPREAYVKLFVSHAALIMSLYKESVMEKVDGSKNVKITDEFFSILIDKIKATSFNTGCAYYKDKENIFDVIRNMLLHGDFDIVDGNKISFRINGEETTEVDIFDVALMNSLLYMATDSVKDGIRHRRMIITKKRDVDHILRIRNRQDIKRVLNSMHCLDVVDQPKRGCERTEIFVRIFNSFMEAFPESGYIQENLPVYEMFRRYLEEYKAIFEHLNMDVSFSVKKATDLPEYKDILGYLLKEIPILCEKGYETENLLVYIISSVNTLLNVKDDASSLLFAGLYNNLVFLKAYLDGEDMSKLQHSDNISNTYVDDMTIAGWFVLFYAMYHYGLDKVFSRLQNTSLEDVLNGDALRYDKLVLPFVDDPNMEIEFDFKTSFSVQLQKIQADVNKIKKAYQSYVSKIEYYRKVKGADAPIPERLIRDRDQAYQEYIMALDFYKRAVEFMKNDCNMFVKNYNVIAHIRNAISHGGVFLDRHLFGDTLNDRVISIKDTKDGKTTYEAIILFRHLIYAFNDENIALVREFLSDKKKKYGLGNEGSVYN